VNSPARPLLTALAVVIVACIAAYAAAPFVVGEKIRRMPARNRLVLAWKIARGKI